MRTKDVTRTGDPDVRHGSRTASTNEKAATFWYETQERAFAPRIADGWPEVIRAPHTKNGRLVRRNGDPSELLAAAKATLDYWESTGFAICEKDCDCVVDRIRAAIAKAEGQ